MIFLKNIFWSEDFSVTTNSWSCNSWIFFYESSSENFINLPGKHSLGLRCDLKLCLANHFHKDVFFGKLQIFANTYSQHQTALIYCYSFEFLDTIFFHLQNCWTANTLDGFFYRLGNSSWKHELLLLDTPF